MKIGLIDVDGHDFPNIPLMKISAWHKSKGDDVEWYTPKSGHKDKVYMSKVFSFTPKYPYYVDADVIEKGGTGYCIKVVNGKEVYDKSKDKELPYEIEHIYPDYSIYNITDTAYGFLTRGCPRGCFFCHVKDKEGKGSYKVADLYEFWRGQKNIVLLDPNILACSERIELLWQLADSGAKVEINQGIDARLMTSEVIEIMNKIRIEKPHMAWDRYQDKGIIVPSLERVAAEFKIKPKNIFVYCLVNYDTSFNQDLERVMILRKMGFSPYIMRYNKENLKTGHILNALARWCNNPAMFWKYKTFDEYMANNRK